MKILISDVENRKSFDIVNMMLLHYDRKDIIPASNDDSMLLKKIYPDLFILRSLVYGEFEQDLKRLINSQPESEQILYLAVEEKTTIFFYAFIRNNSKEATRLIHLLPPEESFNISRDKYRLNVFCTENDIAVPEIIQYTALDEFVKRFVPLIYKPKEGSGSKGIQFVHTPDDLKNIEQREDFFLQRFVGNGVNVEGGFYLMDKGTLISFYSHQRIRTYPPEGGVSVYSQTIENSRIEVIGAKLLSRLNWSGWAMIEFIYDEKSDEYVVIEINPRAWGSILLSEFNNADFLRKYIALATGEQVKTSVINYNTFIRWMFPWDILLFLKKKGKISNFWKLDTKKTCYIGFTYAGMFRSLLFILYSVFSIKHLKKILKG
jgi:hypothetical protein